eukprot:TRINITY_DN44536_c0_g1_i1.p1 TRINITY_DN44536_c0_g1~~TRINITY_DN44536_c0_g1_i1.p1  ORF type:complete len:440 (+),score=74.75 TRINITY_DN44536_c0_g1_i1:255-1574(+)
MATPAPPQAQAGSSQLGGRFVLGRTLGKGAFSKVKEALDNRDGSRVAVKIISKSELQRHNQEELLRREVYVMKELRHPNIVRMFEVFQTRNHIYLILELVECGELMDQIVEQRGLPEATARFYFQQMCVALHYCHSRGVAHRDLKPENMLLGSEDPPRLRISDFGLANLAPPADSSTGGMMQSLCGTPDYVAPEIIRGGEGYNGMSADVWSLGVVLYVTLAGRTPFAAETIPAMFDKIQRGEYHVDPSIPPGAANLLRRMLVVDPAHRIRLADVVQDPWFLVGFAGSQAERAMRDTMSAPVPEPSGADLAGAVSTLQDAASPPPVPQHSGDVVRAVLDCAVPQAVSALTSAFTQAQGNPRLVKNAETGDAKLNGWWQTSGPLTAYTVEVTADGAAGSPPSGRTLVRVHKTRGDAQRFLSYVADVLGRLPQGMVLAGTRG